MSEEMLRGYHFTTEKSIKSIFRKGLKPYPIPVRHALICQMLRRHTGSTKAIWVWNDPPHGFDLWGTLMDRAINHRQTRLYLLSVPHCKEEVFWPLLGQGEMLKAFVHTGNMSAYDGDWCYHEDKPYSLLTKRIPPERLSVVGEWDLIALMEAGYKRPAKNFRSEIDALVGSV